MAWANDNQTLFYNVLDEALRPHQLRRHLLGTPAQDDVIVYQEDDARFFLSISKSKDDMYLLLVLNSKESDERFLEIKNKRFLPAVYAHLISLAQTERLVKLQEEMPAAA